MRVKILLLPALIIVWYALALSISMLNEHFDRSPPRNITATVGTKFTRYNPFRVDMLGVRLEDGSHANVAVLKETSDKIGIDSQIDLVEKRGFLRKTWYQDKAFYDSLESGRFFQGAIHIVLSVLLMYFCFRIARRVFPTRIAALITIASVIIAFFYFEVAL
jgi:hypothetical protein